MHQAPAPLLLRAYSGREDGLMIIGTPDELRRLGQQLIAVDQFSVKEGNWPAEVAHPMVVSPYVDAPDFQLSFHVAGAVTVPASLPLVRRSPHGAVTLVALVLALIGLVSVARWAVSHAL
jgi:hypothetical protein